MNLNNIMYTLHPFLIIDGYAPSLRPYSLSFHIFSCPASQFGIHSHIRTATFRYGIHFLVIFRLPSYSQSLYVSDFVSFVTVVL